MQTFKERVIAVVKDIPEGRTLSYKQVAQRAGSPMAFRAVGMIMSKNFDPSIPCHRVIRTDGLIGDYNRGGAERKAKLLAEEKKLAEQD